jgi:hypothetical protein
MRVQAVFRRIRNGVQLLLCYLEFHKKGALLDVLSNYKHFTKDSES